LATDLASFTQLKLNPDPEVTELPFELTLHGATCQQATSVHG